MATEPKPRKVLFLCTGNSARSIFAEYLMNKTGRRRFEAYSAGSEPSGKVNPFTLQVLREHYKIKAQDARSKSWDEFQETKFDIVITVCDRVRESCPTFPGDPEVIHWSIADPAGAAGSDKQKLRAFIRTAQEIQRRVELLCSVPTEKLGPVLTRSARQVETTRK